MSHKRCDNSPRTKRSPYRDFRIEISVYRSPKGKSQKRGHKNNHKMKEWRVKLMKGYIVESGYMGLIEGSYLLFADETDYEEAYYESQL